MVQPIMEHGVLGYKMEIEIKDKEYAILQRIKSLEGRSELILEGIPKDGDIKEDIEAQIALLTNMLKML